MTETKTIIEALRSLAKDQSNGFREGIVLKAADRLAKQQKRIRNQRREIEALAKDKKRVDGFANWLDAEMKKFMTEPTLRNDWVQYYSLERAKQQLEKLRNGLGEQQQPASAARKS